MRRTRGHAGNRGPLRACCRHGPTGEPRGRTIIPSVPCGYGAPGRTKGIVLCRAGQAGGSRGGWRKNSPAASSPTWTSSPWASQGYWKNSCVLPEDLKNFYLMTDGFQMTWSVKTDDTPMPLGSMVINSVSKLCRLGGSSMYTLPSAPTLADLEDDTDEEGDGDKPEKPHFDSRSLIFELDPCNGNGKVCLVYKHAEPVVSPDTEIWFLDRALYWHFLTKTFTAYYRLLITHLGLPQWQYAFTSYGVSPQAKQWFNMYKPITINTALLSEEADSFVNKLDPNKELEEATSHASFKSRLEAKGT
uniref:Tubulin polyglutamylase complex subunit 2 n=1 Tax=Ficedula albicollis TaxID=59894 RepID=A0A803W1G0_FICAL